MDGRDGLLSGECRSTYRSARALPIFRALSTGQRSRQAPRSSSMDGLLPSSLGPRSLVKTSLLRSLPWIDSTSSSKSSSVYLVLIVSGTRPAEDIFCRRYCGYDADIDEAVCGVEGVRSQIACILDYSVALNRLFGRLVLAYPFGILADRVQKHVCLLVTT
ncbi:hypothetical protein F5B19DRAFT_119566 [Rostrohypoxylon terebratum]|nr:hypothetical protein F5B19DRAFT_119566 [Rostrohypoxylon terebratum]